MRRIDLHTHTCFCDGKDTVEQMIISAIDKGLSVIGILAHSFVKEDPQGSLAYEKENEFIRQVKSLKEKYKDLIKVRVGIEMDINSKVDVSKYDYVIGSCHYFEKDGVLRAIDISESDFISAVSELFDGNYEMAYENYFQSLYLLKQRTGADIVGHFDLITKYNEGDKFFDTSSPKYENAYKKAVDKLIKDGLVFELNTGGLRAKKGECYPSKKIRDYIKERGGKLILSSDAHKKEDIAFMFDSYDSEVR